MPTNAPLPSRIALTALLSVTVLAAQNAQPARQPDVPYVPTTEEAVQAMLKLAGVKKTDVVSILAAAMDVSLSLLPRLTARMVWVST